jgi:LacI family transcriptional regulator
VDRLDSVARSASSGGLLAADILEKVRHEHFPARRAVQVLRQRIRDFLLAAKPAVGARFPTDDELVEATNLSRSTVRRALDALQREGWIVREAGRGSTVGPRRSVPIEDQATSSRQDKETQNNLVRLAVIVYLQEFRRDWFTPVVLRGIDQAADDAGVTVEILGQSDAGVDAMSRRLHRSKPDVLVCLAAGQDNGLIVRDAMLLGIPVIAAGTQMAHLSCPSIMEDNLQGMRLAVEHLAKAGHTRIGCFLNTAPGRWVIDRCRAFLHVTAELGLETDSRLIHWLEQSTRIGGNFSESKYKHAVDQLDAYLDDQKPTALISTGYYMSQLVATVVKRKKLAIPDDLSLITFDQCQWLESSFDVGDLTTIELPLLEMGEQIALRSRNLSEGIEVPRQIFLPCKLRAGATVRALS